MILIRCVPCKEEICWTSDELDYVEIDPTSGHLTVINVIDYEEIHSLRCNVTATDSDQSDSRSSVLQVQVDVTDVNDNWPIFDPSTVETLSIYEYNGSTNEQVVAIFKATDADSGWKCNFDTDFSTF